MTGIALQRECLKCGLSSRVGRISDNSRSACACRSPAPQTYRACENCPYCASTRRSVASRPAAKPDAAINALLGSNVFKAAEAVDLLTAHDTANLANATLGSSAPTSKTQARLDGRRFDGGLDRVRCGVEICAQKKGSTCPPEVKALYRDC